MTSWLAQVAPAWVPTPDVVDSLSGRFVRATGTYQEWAVFSPPRNESLSLEAVVVFDDGSTTTWTPPRRNELIGAYSDYHWQKYAEHAAQRGNSDEWPRLWEPLARYAARDAAIEGRRAVRVTLVTRHVPNIEAVANRDVATTEYVVEYFTFELGTPELDTPEVGDDGSD